jgi:peptide/nickel transport system substrate-binding protein
MPLRRRFSTLKNWVQLLWLVSVVLLALIISGCNLQSEVSSGLTDPTEVSNPAGNVFLTPSVNQNNPASTTSPTDTPQPTEDPTPFEPLSMYAPDCNYGGSLKSIEALDRHSVRFELCSPDVAFLTKIAFPTFGILPAEWFGQGDDGSADKFRQGIIGTGPYQFVDWRPGEELVLGEFPMYWNDDRSGNVQLIVRWNIDELQRIVDLQAGVADGIDNINAFDYSTIESDPNLVLIPRSPLSTAYIGINNLQPPFDDERVRQAIAMGINRQAILDAYFPESFQLANYFTPCIIANGCEGDSWYTFDPIQALSLLEQAGYPDGFETVLTYRELARGYLPTPGAVAQAIKEQLWENLGILVKLDVMESEEFYLTLDSGSLSGLHLLGWGADYPDISNFLDTHFGVQATRQFGDPYIDLVEVLGQGSAILGDIERKPYYQVSNNLIRKHVPAIPLAYGGWYSHESLAAAYRREVQGGHTSPFGFEDFSSILAPDKESFVWIQAAEPLSLYCAGVAESDSLRACSQMIEPLYRYDTGTVTPIPWLAQECTPNQELTIWTCTLRKGVNFHDGTLLDANDVVLSFVVQWDASHEFHQSFDGSFDYFRDFWGGYINSPNP